MLRQWYRGILLLDIECKIHTNMSSAAILVVRIVHRDVGLLVDFSNSNLDDTALQICRFLLISWWKLQQLAEVLERVPSMANLDAVLENHVEPRAVDMCECNQTF